MSEFRDQVSNRLINAAGHPDRAYAILVELKHSMIEKQQRYDRLEGRSIDVIIGMQEMTAFVDLLASDIAADYGIKEGN